MLKKSTLNILLLILISACNLHSQPDTTVPLKKVDLKAYLGLVGQNNLEYAARKFDLSRADAGIEMAKIFPDPSFSYAWFDNGQRRIEMGYGFNGGLSWTAELGGKRKARVDLARSEAELTRFLLQDYFRALRADATLNFLSALRNKQLLAMQAGSYQAMKHLAESDSLRYKAGSISQIDARQSRLEALAMLNELITQEARWKLSLLNMSVLTGELKKDGLYEPLIGTAKLDRDFNLQQLITAAQNTRADALAALQNKDVSQKAIMLAKANRVADIELRSGLIFASHTKNIIAPTPSFFQLSAGLAIPLKFSNRYAGELKMAYYSAQQAELMYRKAELLIEAEVTQAYFNYEAGRKQMNQFNNGMLDEAKKVLEGKTYSYQRGETSLLEVLNARRTYNMLQASYYEAVFNYASSLVELEKAAGIWDIEF